MTHKPFIAQKDEVCSICKSELPKGAPLFICDEMDKTDNEILCPDCYELLYGEL